VVTVALLPIQAMVSLLIGLSRLAELIGRGLWGRRLPYDDAYELGARDGVAKLIYSMLTSLDGYVADEAGNFDWANPDEEVHGFINDLARPAGTMLLGRRMFDVLEAWESDEMLVDQPESIVDFAKIWRASDKVVFSRSLEAPRTARTRIEREFDPEAIRRLKETADRDLSIGGPDLAAQALRAGLVEEIHLFLNPIVVGGGNAALPDDVRVSLELLDTHRFANGVAHLAYRTTN
jgi:dihydrofolate reductase